MTTPVIEETLGSVAEAKELYDKVGDMFSLDDPTSAPPGWTFVGQGGSRRVYRGPSGVCYKIEYPPCDPEYDDKWNEREHENFGRIRQAGNLLPGWRVPKSHLHHFRGTYTRYNNQTRKREKVETPVTMLAIEYIEGEAVGGWKEPMDGDIKAGFRKVGLADVYGKNAIKCPDGTVVIIDAAETLREEV